MGSCVPLSHRKGHPSPDHRLRLWEELVQWEERYHEECSHSSGLICAGLTGSWCFLFLLDLLKASGS